MSNFAPKELFAAVTAAASADFTLGADERARVNVYGMTSDDTVAVQIPSFNGEAWANLYESGAQVLFDVDTTTSIVFDGPGTFRLNKGTTATATGAYMLKGFPR